MKMGAAVIMCLFVCCVASAKDKVGSWIDIKYDMLLRQGEDYTCGAASLATILKYYYDAGYIDQDMILDRLPKEKASFYDLKKAAASFGFEGEGFYISIVEMLKIKAPVIAYIKTPLGNDHFVVIRGVFDGYVYIGDPSVGNYLLSKGDFINMWVVGRDGKGSILYIYKEGGRKNNAFFQNAKMPLMMGHRFSLMNIPR